MNETFQTIETVGSSLIHPPTEKSAYTSRNFSPEIIALRSKEFLKAYEPYLQIAKEQEQAWEAKLEKYRDNLDDKDGRSPEQRVLADIKEELDKIREKKYSKEELASKDVLPDVLGHLSAAVYLTFGYRVHTNQLQAVIVHAVGNKNEHHSPRDKVHDFFHDFLSAFPPDFKEDPEGKGNIAQLPTGDGKTLTAALSAIFFSLEGREKAVWVGSTHDYLAQEGMIQMGPLYENLGMSVSVLTSGQDIQRIYDKTVTTQNDLPLRSLQKRSEAYSCDVVYAATDEFGHDYDRDTIELIPLNIRQVKGLNVFIIDEVDGTLIAKGASPLVIEAPLIRINPLTRQPEEYERSVEISGKPYTPRELHLLFRDITSLLDPEDFDNDRNVQLPDLYDTSDQAEKARQKKKISERNVPDITRDLAYTQIDQKLHTAGILGSSQTLETTTQFTAVQKEHLYTAMQSLGIEKVTELMKAFGLIGEECNDFYQSNDADIILYYLRPALRAQSEFLNQGTNYGTSDDITLINPATGQVMEGQQLSEGGHQALQALHHLPISAETHRLADTIYSEFTAQFDRIAGLTATAVPNAEELSNAYHLDVIEIPPNVPSERKDLTNDIIYLNQQEKFEAIFKREIVPFYQQDVHRPILIGLHTSSEVHAFYEFLDQKIKDYNKQHSTRQIFSTVNYVTWDNRDKARDIFSQIGLEGHITITDMAGRGVDSILGGARPPSPDDFTDPNAYSQALAKWEEDVQLATDIAASLDNIQLGGAQPEQSIPGHEQEYQQAIAKWKDMHDRINNAGGLHAIGEPIDPVSDMQFAGRAGRNGNKGSSIFYSSLDDYLFVRGLGNGYEQHTKAQKAIGVPIEGEVAQSLIKRTQAIILRSERDSRQALQEQYFPLREARLAYQRQRHELLMQDAAFPPQDSALPSLQPHWAEHLEELPISKQILPLIDTRIESIISSYDEALSLASKEEVPILISQVVDNIAVLLALPTEKRQLLQDDFMKKVTRSKERIVPVDILPAQMLQSTVKEFAHTQYNELLKQLAQQIQNTLPSLLQQSHFQRYHTFLTDTQLDILLRQALKERPRQILLRVMDKNWQIFVEERLHRNQHLQIAQKSLQKEPLPAMRIEVHEAYQKFGQQVQEDIVMGLFANLGNLENSDN